MRILRKSLYKDSSASKFYIRNIQIELLISLTIQEIRCLTKGCYLEHAAVLLSSAESPFMRHSKERSREED